MTDVIVVGGGPAGAASAVHLARAGRSVLVLERDAGPTGKVCGEFLGAEACAELRGLGIDLRALGAEPITRVRLVSRRRTATAALPFEAAGLSRAVLDPAVRDAAAEAGARFRPGTRVTEANENRAVSSDRASFSARHVVVATGKHDLRGSARRVSPRAEDIRIGFKQHMVLDTEAAGTLAGTVELHFFPGGYAGLMPVGGGRHTFSLVVSRRGWRAAGMRHPALLTAIRAACPALDARLRGSVPLGARPLAVGAVPYGFRLWRSGPRDGIWRVGDQAAVTPSLTGAGMGLALIGARLLGRHLSPDPRAPQRYLDALRRAHGRQIAWAQLFQSVLERETGRDWVVAAAALAPWTIRAAARLTRPGC